MYTDEEKTIILEKNGYEFMEGYCFSNPTDQDYDTHFVSKEDVERAVAEGAKSYFWKDGHFAGVQVLEEAWENFCEDYWDENEEYKTEEDMLCSLSKFLEPAEKVSQ
jgi:hypothetical protein